MIKWIKSLFGPSDKELVYNNAREAIRFARLYINEHVSQGHPVPDVVMRDYFETQAFVSASAAVFQREFNVSPEIGLAMIAIQDNHWRLKRKAQPKFDDLKNALTKAETVLGEAML